MVRTRGVQTLASARRVLAARTVDSGACASALVEQNRWTTVRLVRPGGPQTIAIRLTAETNLSRTTTSVRPVR